MRVAMRKIQVLAFILVCTMISGCGLAYRQNAAELAKTAKPEDYGPKPSSYEKTIKDAMEIVLIDPESARYSNWQEPRQAVIPSGISAYGSFSTKPILGWQVDVYINSKNRLGGYTGAKRLGFFFVNNNLYAYGEYSPGAEGYGWDYLIKQ